MGDPQTPLADWPDSDLTVDASFADVPSADADATVDPHWRELRAGSILPASYLPPSMPGHHSRWVRLVAVAVAAGFLAATAAGICLTYGPQPFGQ